MKSFLIVGGIEILHDLIYLWEGRHETFFKRLKVKSCDGSLEIKKNLKILDSVFMKNFFNPTSNLWRKVLTFKSIENKNFYLQHTVFTFQYFHSTLLTETCPLNVHHGINLLLFHLLLYSFENLHRVSKN